MSENRGFLKEKRENCEPLQAAAESDPKAELKTYQIRMDAYQCELLREILADRYAGEGNPYLLPLEDQRSAAVDLLIFDYLTH